MKVLTFTSLFPNKADAAHGIFVLQRIAHLARQSDVSLQVIAPIPYFPKWLSWSKWQAFTQIPEREAMEGVTVHHPRYPLLPKISMPLHGFLMFLGSLRLAHRLHLQTGFDCIDAHYVYPDGFAAALLGKVLNIPVFVTLRGTDMNLFPSFPLIRPQIRWALRQAIGTIAVSNSLRQRAVELGLSPEKIQVIGNGVGLRDFYPLERSLSRARLDLPQDALVLLCVGGLVPGKGHRLLIYAFAEIAKEFPKLRLYIVGKGPESEKLQQLCRNLGLCDRILLVGPKPHEDLKFWYSAANVSCLISLREGWPNVVLESLACGTPVVATKVGGIPDILVSEDLGVLVEPRHRSVVDGLRLALHRSWDHMRIVAYARKRTWEVVAEEVENYLVRCISDSNLSNAAKAN